MKIKTGIGQDSHSFDLENDKVCKIAGITFEDSKGLKGNSDSDVVLHAIVNALTGIHGKIVLGPITDKMCKAGETDSERYVQKALEFMNGFQISNISISIECLKPKIIPKVEAMKEKIARIVDISVDDVSITATTGEGLTDFGKGLGIQAFVSITATKE